MNIVSRLFILRQDELFTHLDTGRCTAWDMLRWGSLAQNIHHPLR